MIFQKLCSSMLVRDLALRMCEKKTGRWRRFIMVEWDVQIAKLVEIYSGVNELIPKSRYIIFAKLLGILEFIVMLVNWLLLPMLKVTIGWKKFANMPKQFLFCIQSYICRGIVIYCEKCHDYVEHQKLQGIFWKTRDEEVGLFLKLK